MKIEKLNENKIRITLNMEDLKERDIDYHSFMANSIESQDIFLDMLDTAEKEVGFHTEDCRIMIEALALKDGHFVLTITKFAHVEQGLSLKDGSLSSKRKTLHIKRKNPKLSSHKAIYSFDSFDTFCEYCAFLEKSSYHEELLQFAKTCDLYAYQSNYYLIFTDINVNADVAKFICLTITEFAHYIDHSNLFEKKITEYGNLIMKDFAITKTIEHFA